MYKDVPEAPNPIFALSLKSPIGIEIVPLISTALLYACANNEFLLVELKKCGLKK